MMKKLLLIGSNSGGIHLHTFWKLVKDQFHETLVVSNENIDFAPCHKTSFSLKNPLQVYRSVRALRSIIDEFKPSIIHVHQANSFALITGFANRKKHPLVLTAWGSDVLMLPKKSSLHRWLVKRALDTANIVTADSQDMIKAINVLAPQKEVHKINFGVDLDLDVDVKKDRELCLYSNRMHEPLYQIDKILSETGSFLNEHPDCILAIAGKGSATKGLINYTEQQIWSNQVEFMGFLSAEENKTMYLKCLIYISIPESDGTSVSLLEAMAYGCIPLVSNLPSNQEWIEDGVNGIILQTDENLVAAINRALVLNLNDVQSRNLRIIEKKATKTVNAQLFMSLYERLLKPDSLV